MTLSALADRLGSTAKNAAAAVVPLRKDWRAMLETVDTKITEAQTRRAGVLAERDAVLLDAAAGDDAARKSADRLEKHIEDLDRELSRLHATREQARNRLDAEASAEAAERHAQRRQAIRAAAKKWDEQARRIDDAIAELVAQLATFVCISEEVTRLVGGNDVANEKSTIHTAIPHVVNGALSGTGLNFSRPMFMLPEKRKLAAWIRGADYLFTLMQQEH